MSDDTNNRGGQDRARVAGDQEYEVRYFADKHGISVEEAQRLIDRHGNSREELDRAAERLKA
jgi:acetyl-CoA acetyltransferase